MDRDAGVGVPYTPLESGALAGRKVGGESNER